MKIFFNVLVAVVFAFAAVSVHAGLTVTAAATVYGVNTSNQLVRFNSATPGTVVMVGAITGLQGGENVVGIDFRPATGQLYALGSNSRLYILNRMTAAATFVVTLSTPLNGTNFGVDFNPVVDRFRIVSDSGQNLRVNPVTGMAIVDGAISGAATSVDGAAYTNSFNGAATTTLYDISSTTDSLYTQNPPNNGTLVLQGPLGVDVTGVSGFDILAVEGTAIAAMTTASGLLTSLYTINLTTGAASSVGLIGLGTTSLRAMAVETANPSNFQVFGLTTMNNLVRFNSNRPNTILSNVAITGLQGGESLVGIDFRPATGRLFGIGSTSRIYMINTFTGAATAVGTAGAFTLSGANFGVDFNPLPDRIRVTSNMDQNLRLNPIDGTLTATDTVLAYATGDPNAGQNPNVVGSAYTNNFTGATTTTLYDIDSTLGILATQNPPNNGTLNTVGSLGVNISGETGFDIAGANNTALAAFQPNGLTASSLYSINLTTGSAAVIGPIGGLTIRDIAIARSSAAGAAGTILDYDGDGRTDLSIFRPSQNLWFNLNSFNSSVSIVQFGLAQSDIVTPGDYDGDGRTDISIWRTNNGVFFVNRSSDNTVSAFQWGSPGDEPVVRDYDGDSRSDFAIARRTGGQIVWFILNSSNGMVRIEQFGLDTDFTTPGDYDGDGRFDLAVQRGVPGQQATFFVNRSTEGFTAVAWGLGGDLVVPGDYDGDGITDFSVVRQGTPYTWFILRSSDGQLQASQFGIKPHFTTQGDYDGDGRTDVSVWDPLAGDFFYIRSVTGSTVITHFGQNGDYPVANYDTH